MSNVDVVLDVKTVIFNLNTQSYKNTVVADSRNIQESHCKSKKWKEMWKDVVDIKKEQFIQENNWSK